VSKIETYKFSGKINLTIRQSLSKIDVPKDFDDGSSSRSPSIGSLKTDYSLGFSGTNDSTDKNLPKLNFTLDARSQETPFVLLNFVVYGDTIYAYIQEAQDLGIFNISPFLNSWLSVNLSEIQKSLPEASEYNEFFLTADGKKKMAIAVSENPPIIITKRLKDEELSGIAVYHFKYKVDNENLVKVYQRWLELTDSSNSDPDMKTFRENLKDVKFSQGDVWIGKNDKLPYKFYFGFKASKPEVDTDIDFEITANFSDFNTPVSIDIPTESKSITELIREYLSNFTLSQ